MSFSIPDKQLHYQIFSYIEKKQQKRYNITVSINVKGVLQ